jgi:hypothetical protein
MRHSSPAALAIARIRVAILRSGPVRFNSTPDADTVGDGLAPAVRTYLPRAAQRGAGHAVLDLGSSELDTSLASDLAFLRDIGRAFVTRLCAVPDLDDKRLSAVFGIELEDAPPARAGRPARRAKRRR